MRVMSHWRGNTGVACVNLPDVVEVVAIVGDVMVVDVGFISCLSESTHSRRGCR